MKKYKLSFVSNNLDYNIGVFNGKRVNLNACEGPLKLYRGKERKEEPQQPNGDNSQEKNDEGEDKDIAVIPKKTPFSKKTRVYYTSAETFGNLEVRKREILPWIIEDADGEINYVGKLEGDQNSNYVLFSANETTGGFDVIPSKHWYKFNQKITYRTLTTDEAEEQMNKKGVKMNRWMMRTANNNQADDGQSKSGLKVTAKSMSRLKERTTDEMLFEDIFEDDDEGGLEDEEGEEKHVDEELELRKKGKLEDIQELEKKKSKSKSKETLKVLKKMKQTYEEDGEDEDGKDPYALSEGEALTESEEEGEGEDDESSKNKMSKDGHKDAEDITKSFATVKRTALPKGKDTANMGIMPSVIRKPGEPIKHLLKREKKVASSISEIDRSSKKAKLSSGSSTPTMSSSRSSSVASGYLITEDEILDLFQTERQLAIKDIINKFVGQVKSEPKNKEVLLNIIKKITQKTGNGEFLELKSEYRR